MTEVSEVQRQITSGYRVEKPSDDPGAIGTIMESSSSLRSLEQHRKNLNLAGSRLALEDMALEQITTHLTRAKELAVSQGGDTANADTRAAVKEEVDGLREALIDLGNTRFAGSFMFGGDYADTRPFTATGHDPTRPPAGTFTVEGGEDSFLEANHSGMEIFVDSGVLDSLEALSTALGNNSSTEIQASIQGLDHAFEDIQGLVADLGGRINRVDRAINSLDSLEIEVMKQESELRDTDLEEAITRLANLQVTYEAAMLANSRILNLTLTDYLR
jgi:flagellar hook-associated protein 3 FlgL